MMTGGFEHGGRAETDFYAVCLFQRFMRWLLEDVPVDRERMAARFPEVFRDW
jgi:hypothetical protein